MREVLYDVEWQRLRISLMQARNDAGGWTTQEGMFSNLRKLDAYLFESSVGVERTLCRYRINNCLNAVVMGYHGQHADKVLIEMVRSYRQDNIAGFPRYDVVKAAMCWKWDPQLRQLIELFREDKEEFTFLEENLKHRATKGDRLSRPELYQFLELMKTASRT